MLEELRALAERVRPDADELRRMFEEARWECALFFAFRLVRGLFEPDESNLWLELDAICFLNPRLRYLHQFANISCPRVA